VGGENFGIFLCVARDDLAPHMQPLFRATHFRGIERGRGGLYGKNLTLKIKRSLGLSGP